MQQKCPAQNKRLQKLLTRKYLSTTLCRFCCICGNYLKYFCNPRGLRKIKRKRKSDNLPQGRPPDLG